MLATVFSGAIFGVDAYEVEIEVNAAMAGDPQIVIVGLPDAAVKESKDRVWTAIVNSAFKTHLGRTTINLAPADKKKEGPCFDLPIAIGMLAASDEIDGARLPDFAMVGELAQSRNMSGVWKIIVVYVREIQTSTFAVLNSRLPISTQCGLYLRVKSS